MLSRAMLLGIVALPVIATAFAVAVEGELSDVRERSAAFLTSPTPRTITDERQVRIVATTVPGLEVAVELTRGTHAIATSLV